MPKDNNQYDDDSNTSQTDFDDDDSDSIQISDDEETARDDYLDKLVRAIEKIQQELEDEIGSDDSISVDAEKVADAIGTLTELLNIRSEQLKEKDLPTHVDEKVEEYR